MRHFILLILPILLLVECNVNAGDDARAQVDVAIKDESWSIPADFTLRARITTITPSEASDVNWRWGGEGMGGTPTTGTFAKKLSIGEWSPVVPVASFVKGKFPGRLFLTVTCGKPGKRATDGTFDGQSRGVEIEFEFSYQNKVVKTFTEKGPDGGTVGLIIPASQLAGGKSPNDPAFLEHLSGLEAYATQRFKVVSSVASPAPFSHYNVITDLGGYGNSVGYGIRHTNKAMVETECRTLALLGVNGFAGAPVFLRSAVAAHEGFAKPFAHVSYLQLGGYPVPTARKGQTIPDAGCPSAPGVAARTAEMIEKGVATAMQAGTKEVWWRTEDEIGSIFDHSSEGKAHLNVCPRCGEAYRMFLKSRGVKPSELGATDWSTVKPAAIFAKDTTALTTPGDSLGAYYTAMYVNEVSSRLFTPLREKLAHLNADKIKNNLEKQPFMYSFALRGNTFLMGGHSLDFFDFYRNADNAFVYETSNRDARILGWDSYLCDVGRVMSQDQKLKFGIYVKPHRGGPIQRTFTAAGRGAQMFYWYTYGPDYVKGDSFAESLPAVQDTARAASLLGRAEPFLYGSTWLRPPEVAVVNPRSSELWNRMAKGSPAAFENAKWTYSALQHAHIPVDPIDEVMLATSDLAHYKVIYISGTHVTRAAAEKVAAWVRAGGTLYTSGGGLVRDEGNQPLDMLLPLLGLKSRNAIEAWYKVSAYGATALETYDEAKNILAPAPDGAAIVAQAPYASFKPAVGREVLLPAAGTDVLATFADGSAALTRHAVEKGSVYVAGFYPGLEYSAKVRRADYDMSLDFDIGRRNFIASAALDRVKPIVDASEPLIEGVLVKNEAGVRSIVLMNWAYRAAGKMVTNGRVSSLKANIAFKEITVTVRGAGAVQSVQSLALNKTLPITRVGDDTVITLSEMNEADVLVLK